MPWDVPPYPPYTDKADVPLYLQSLRSDLRSLLSDKTHTHVVGSGAGQINVINSTTVLGNSDSLAPSCKLVSETLVKYVSTLGNVTIEGTKTFSSPVVVPASTADTHAVNQGQIAKLVADVPKELNNLLINGEFTVNQRGLDTYSTSNKFNRLPEAYYETGYVNGDTGFSVEYAYCADGWKYPPQLLNKVDISAISVGGGLVITSKTGSTGVPYVEQTRDIAETPGRTSEYVVQVYDGTDSGLNITSVELAFSSGGYNNTTTPRRRFSRTVAKANMSPAPTDPATGKPSGFVAVFPAVTTTPPVMTGYWESVDRIHVRINLKAGTTTTTAQSALKYVKLLRGHTGVPHVSEEYSKALLRCHRRYFRTTDPQLGTAVFTTTTGNGYLTLLVPGPMRAAPAFRATNSSGGSAPIQFYGSDPANLLTADNIGVAASPLGVTASATAVTGSEMIRYDGSGPGVSVRLKGPGTDGPLVTLTSANVGKSSVVVPGGSVSYEFEAEPR